MFSDLVKVNSDKRFFRLHSFVIYWFNQSMCLSTVDEIGKLIEEQDEEARSPLHKVEEWKRRREKKLREYKD